MSELSPGHGGFCNAGDVSSLREQKGLGAVLKITS